MIKMNNFQYFFIKSYVVDVFQKYTSKTFFDSVECPFQDYFTHRDEPIDRWGETGVPRENHLTHPQAELVLSHMWPVRGSNLHQTQR